MDSDKKKLAGHMLRELESPSKKLTDWELNFLESITQQFEDRGSLSERQMEVLERIYAEKTS